MLKPLREHIRGRRAKAVLELHTVLRSTCPYFRNHPTTISVVARRGGSGDHVVAYREMRCRRVGRTFVNSTSCGVETPGLFLDFVFHGFNRWTFSHSEGAEHVRQVEIRKTSDGLANLLFDVLIHA